ncbi:hypothetical protein HYFRA_00005887 [Hymenoscyphus fraxineus]|uniref:SGNH hydrolase-type esterase domain-containing protein n=1 Tax=Hymenoscyphus fraxineus TaxID=746836 RepID=A0A9N9KZE9_9HELO|nr:hypothetical protein HYFRA_00005887 [Hymenoscyphus fraxineus]
MHLRHPLYLFLTCLSLTTSTILQNGQVRETNYPDTKIDASLYNFQSFPPNSTELSYKGRWDSKYISWWSAPGLKFGFTGDTVAITFGNHTSNGVLIAYRLSNLDWQFTNISTSSTHLLISPSTPGINTTYPINPHTLELRVTNWAYGLQISSVHLAPSASLVALPKYGRKIEVIGDSLSAGDLATLEGLSSYAFGLGEGIGETEYSITAYPGVCAADRECWGNGRGMVWQWWYTSDTSPRAGELYGREPERWDFGREEEADVVVICLGTNDANEHNQVSEEEFVDAYRRLIMGVKGVWPGTKIVIVSLWNGFYSNGNSYAQAGAFTQPLHTLYTTFNSPTYLQNPILYNHTTNSTYTSTTPFEPFVYYFNTTGILNHNDISPLYHPTDFGHVKVASHLMAFFRWVLGWELRNGGRMVQSGTGYWNDVGEY